MLPIEIFAVAIGGALGSVGRFLLSRWMLTFSHRLPWGIITCNLAGSFLIGLIGGLIMFKSDFSLAWRAFLMIGVLGGFTTFSSFSLDTLYLWRSGNMSMAFANIAITLIGCLFATYIGLLIARYSLV